jgi:acetyl-CoA carboxylase biotin carboxyl carrier protein
VSEQEDLAAIERAARDLLPALTERLVKHGLGEIEVSHGELRLRVAASGTGAPPIAAAVLGTLTASDGSQPVGPGASVAGTAPSSDGAAPRHPVTAPAVGHFVYADGLGPGIPIEKGDAIGWVEMLGVRHDVRAPRRGTVRHLIAESGEAVEYGQPLIDMEDGA